MPELTLEPFSANPIKEAAPAPNLVLNPPGADAAQAAVVQGPKEAVSTTLDENRLTEAERKMVDDFAEKIDLTDSNMILQYGSAAQKNVAAFSENALNSVRTKDLGGIGQALSSLVVELKGFSKPEKKGIFGFFQKKLSELEMMRNTYARVESNVDRICRVLEQHQVTLMKDVAMLD